MKAWALDPVARWVFARRFPAAQVTGVDALTARGKFAPEKLREALPRDACVLFTNVLGQLVYWARLHRVLEGREWASFHDRLSGFGVFAPAPTEWRDDRSLSMGFEGAAEVESHETELLRPACALGLRYFDWRITPRRVHRIEGFWSL